MSWLESMQGKVCNPSDARSKPVDDPLRKALIAIMEDFGVKECYCRQLVSPGKCGYCLALMALEAKA